MNWQLLKAYGAQVFIAADQLLNALIPPIDGTLSWADETLSARCYRAHRDGRILGRLFMRPIDLLFFWQGPGHCKNAYIKEFERKNYPEEYRQGGGCRFSSPENNGAACSVWGIGYDKTLHTRATHQQHMTAYHCHTAQNAAFRASKAPYFCENGVFGAWHYFHELHMRPPPDSPLQTGIQKSIASFTNGISKELRREKRRDLQLRSSSIAAVYGLRFLH